MKKTTTKRLFLKKSTATVNKGWHEGILKKYTPGFYWYSNGKMNNTSSLNQTDFVQVRNNNKRLVLISIKNFSLKEE